MILPSASVQLHNSYLADMCGRNGCSQFQGNILEKQRQIRDVTSITGRISKPANQDEGCQAVSHVTLNYLILPQIWTPLCKKYVSNFK
jgi:hypothetical protein